MQNNTTKTVSQIIDELWKKLKESGLLIHSFLAEQNGNLLKESYQAPYTDKDLHRMFSITKSFTSLAIGFLCSEGQISLNDRITDFFPEYCSTNTIHPWIKEMTIRHMLCMETCYTHTTFKDTPDKNWVETFFTTTPSHRSGQIFLYDTSSSHTLAALVKKLTGKGVLDYLREKCLDKLEFSKEAYIMLDPFGSEMGGTGLMALPMDLLKMGRYCMNTIKQETGAFADYLREAVSFQVPTIHSGPTFDEQQGYGYQFWQVRGGFAMYGMGGQYVLFYPQLDLILVITADTQKISGGHQIILSMVHDAVSKLSTSKIKTPAPVGPRTGNTSYRLLENPSGFTNLSLSFDSLEGTLTLCTKETTFHIPFSFDALKESVLEKYDQKITVKGMWADSNSLYLPVQIVGKYVGSIHFMLHLSDEKITVWMKKVQESYFNEFQGLLEGEKE